MKETSFTIRDCGLHARPAARLAQAARDSGSRITLSLDGREADAESVIGVMALGATAGASVSIRAEGGDEDGAISAVLAALEDD